MNEKAINTILTIAKDTAALHVKLTLKSGEIVWIDAETARIDGVLLIATDANDNYTTDFVVINEIATARM